MKKIIIVIITILIITVSFVLGRQTGIHHAIYDSEIYTVTRYNPDNPNESAWNGYDQEIFINLDGEEYVHGMRQG